MGKSAQHFAQPNQLLFPQPAAQGSGRRGIGLLRRHAAPQAQRLLGARAALQQHLLQHLPGDLPVFKAYQHARHVLALSSGHSLQQSLCLGQQLGFLLPRRAHRELHAPGPHRGQQHPGILRAEQKRRVPGPFFHQLQQHILILHRQPAAVRKQKHLARALVGLDERIAAQGPQGVHGQVLAVAVSGGDDIRMDAAQDLAAGGAAQAGPVLLREFKGRGVEPRRPHQVAAAGKDHAVGQLAAAAGPADAPLQGGIHQRHLLAKKTNTLLIITRAPRILNIPRLFFL